ncbi:hypothetical protein MP228_006900 [Amoeboaphelidium protococcarum]|nr:hypothetical protein MP228_006900 [Amoeboaphelidium protococcarum]
MKDSGKVFECHFDGCCKKYPCFSKLQIHLNSHNNIRPFQCEMCDKAYIRKDHLQDHVRRQHGDAQAEKCHQCEHCEKSFYTKQQLQRHCKSHHLTIDQASRLFACTYLECDAKFVKKAQLLQHVQAVHDIKDGSYYACGIDGCEWSFPYPSKLMVHRTCHLRKDTPAHFACGFNACRLVFDSALQLKQHINDVHNNVAQQCPHCGIQLKNKTSLQTHLNCAHSANRSQSYDCIICGRVFSTSYNVKAHIVSVHHKGSSEQSLQCSTCKQSFTCKGSLKRHQTRANCSPPIASTLYNVE